MAHNNNEQDQNAIEKLNSNLSNAGEKIMENRTVILWSVTAVLVVACCILAYIFFYQNPRQKNAFEAYNQVEINAAGNDSVAAVEYKKVADKYGSSDAGHLAALSAAEAFYNQGKYKEALNYLDKFKTSEPILRSNALVMKGDCYVNLKKYPEAIETFKKAIDECDNNPQIEPRVLLKLANVYDAQKNYKEALGCYEQIQNEYPNFELGSGLGIEAYIAREQERIGK